MINTASAGILAAVCTAIGASLVALATVLYNRRNDKRRRQMEERDVIGKYRDPLLYAREDLDSPFGIFVVALSLSRQTRTSNCFLEKRPGHHTTIVKRFLIYLISRVFCLDFYSPERYSEFAL